MLRPNHFNTYMGMRREHAAALESNVLYITSYQQMACWWWQLWCGGFRGGLCACGGNNWALNGDAIVMRITMVDDDNQFASLSPTDGCSPQLVLSVPEKTIKPLSDWTLPVLAAAGNWRWTLRVSIFNHVTGHNTLLGRLLRFVPRGVSTLTIPQGFFFAAASAAAS